MNGCTCAGPDGPCEACIAAREAWEENYRELASDADTRNSLIRAEHKAKPRRFSGEPLTGFGDLNERV